MKKFKQYALCLLAVGAFYSCNNDDDTKTDPVTEEPKPEPAATLAVKLATDFTVEQYSAVEITPEVTIENGDKIVPQYKWSIKKNGKDGVAKDSIIGDTKSLLFISPTADTYTVDLTVTLDKIIKQASAKVVVSATGKTYVSKALTLVDYLPAPAYVLDNYEFTTKTEALTEMQQNLKDETEINLGTFGGSIITAFDHTVINAYGKRDFIIQAVNAGVKYCPLSVYVAYDANKNGIADKEEWYEIAGSEYYKSTTVKNYEVTYFKPDEAKTAVSGTLDWQFDVEYLKWSDNKNASGNITKVKKWKRFIYYPQWMGDSYTVKGTKLAIPVKDVSDGAGTAFNVGTYEWGYGGIKDPSIDISWAVDSNGNKVHLPGIDFVKVYVSNFVSMGGLDLLTNSFQNAEDLNFPKVK